MQKAAEKYAEEDEEFAASAERIVPQGPPGALEGPSSASTLPPYIGAGLPENAEGTAGNALQRRFIVCPKCGEKIWL